MRASRSLVIVADDYGIGPETSRGILELGLEGRLSASVLLVNSPFAEDAIHHWQRWGRPLELGWHPNLTLDRPIAPPETIRSLVDAEGKFRPLGQFLKRIVLGLIRRRHVVTEFTAQYQRFLNLVGHPPRIINSHQHVAVFPPVGSALLQVLSEQSPRPYLRRISEPRSTLARVRGAGVKRLGLHLLGSRLARRSHKLGYPGCDSFAGITDPECVARADFFVQWLNIVTGPTVELMVHPGYRDESLIGRDCQADNSCVSRRVHELALIRNSSFREVIRRQGFQVISPLELDAMTRWRIAS